MESAELVVAFFTCYYWPRENIPSWREIRATLSEAKHFPMAPLVDSIIDDPSAFFFFSSSFLHDS